MKVSSVSVSYPNYSRKCCVKNGKVTQQSAFRGRHDCAKFFGGLTASLGTLGALGGIAIMTGGISIPITLAYGAFCGGIGAGVGHMIDKDQPEYHQKKK